MCCSFWRPQSCTRYPQPSCRAASGLISDASVRRILRAACSMWRGASGIGLTEGAARLIARLADGAMRDALSMLDRAAAAGAVDEQTVTAALGVMGQDDSLRLAGSLKAGDLAAAVGLLDRAL